MHATSEGAVAKLNSDTSQLFLSTDHARKSFAAKPITTMRGNVTPRLPASRRLCRDLVSVGLGNALQLVPRGAQVLQLDALAPVIEDLYPRGVQRIVKQPALCVRQAARGQGLVDLLHGEESTADAPREQGLARLVRSADLQRRHPRSFTVTA